MFGKKTSVKRGLKIIIVGCGKVGVTLVEQLSKEGHDITIVDKNAEKIQEIANFFDIMGLAGNGASYSVLMEAGIEEADLIIAVTESDELNLLCCTMAKQVGDCAAIARVRTPDYSQEAAYLREKLGLAMRRVFCSCHRLWRHILLRGDRRSSSNLLFRRIIFSTG